MTTRMWMMTRMTSEGALTGIIASWDSWWILQLPPAHNGTLPTKAWC